MNKNIDLTLNALFIGDHIHGEKLNEHREYDRKHGVEQSDRWLFRGALRDSIFASLGLVGGHARVRFEDWYRRIFFDDGYMTPLQGDDVLITRERILGGDLSERIDPYARFMSGEQCDCCGKRLNIVNRALNCFGLCDRCNNMDESPQRARRRIFDLEEIITYDQYEPEDSATFV